MALSAARTGFLACGVPESLVNELLEAFAEAKRRFFAADLRPNSIEGGRFSEAVIRILQWETDGGNFTPLGRTLPGLDKLLAKFENAQGYSDSVRIHIPRTLRLIYDIRNKRDIAHLADGIDPNIQDATLVIRNMEWVLAELVRIYHKVPAVEAQQLIEDLVTREVPVIQEVNGYPRILKPLQASDYCLVLLYWKGASGTTIDQLSEWVRPPMRTNLRRTLRQLDARNLLHIQGTHVQILLPGEKVVEDSGLIQPA